MLPLGNGWTLYRTLQPRLETGDVVLFVGYGWVGSTLQKYQQRPWLHMGMVMVFPEYDMLLVWEFAVSKSLEVSDKTTGRFKLNAQLTDMGTKLRDARYYRVAVRKLVCERTPAMMSALMALKKRLETKGFEGSLSVLVENRSLPTEDLSALYSGELLAMAFREMGLLPADCDPGQYPPSFWTQPGAVELQGGAVLEPCVHIERFHDPSSRSMMAKE